jgi:hypothetical protein
VRDREEERQKGRKTERKVKLTKGENRLVQFFCQTRGVLHTHQPVKNQGSWVIEYKRCCSTALDMAATQIQKHRKNRKIGHGEHQKIPNFKLIYKCQLSFVKNGPLKWHFLNQQNNAIFWYRR